MKVIIDIPEDEFNAIKNTAFVEDKKTIFKQKENDRKCTMGLFHIIDEVKNGTPIPDNATNGDVIKAMFTNTELHKESDYVSLTIQDGVYLEDRDGSWWFAPYQKGGK